MNGLEMKRHQKLLLMTFLFAGINCFAMLNTDFIQMFLTKSSTNLDQERKTIDVATSVSTTVSLKQMDEIQNDTLIFSSLKKAHSYMNLQTNVFQMKRIIIQYSDFHRQEPLFCDDEDRQLFFQSPVIQDNLKPNSYDKLRGVIEIVKNGSFQMEYSCGFPSKVNYFTIPRPSSRHFQMLVPLIIPMSFLFQHFLDGTMPKIVQILPLLRNPNVKILLEYPIHNIVYEVIQKLNLSQDQVVWHTRGDIRTVYTADAIIFACIAPPVHPELWQGMREAIGVSQNLQKPFSESNVILLTRTGASNDGRRLVNSQEVKDLLQKRYKNRFFVFYNVPSLADCLEFFGSTGIIIGSHGGALYNMYFAPTDANVVEFAPVLPGGRDIKALPHAIFWASAHMIGQKYWRMPIVVANYVNDMVVDLSKLECILDKIDNSYHI